MREYSNKGKTQKYFALKDEFEKKYKKAAEHYLRKNIDSLKEANPGKAHSILKKMGARPGELEDEGNFHLQSHEGLSALESAEKIADHFSKISSEFSPLNIDALPSRVKDKIQHPEKVSKVPAIEDYEIYQMIRKANKPKSGVPGDLPRRIVTEFTPELCAPIGMIFRSILNSSKIGPVDWPDAWKKEYGIPLQKSQDPQNENDLRVISLTSFFSKVLEGFVLKWLMEKVKAQIDPKQFGGLKGNSVCHYLIELINFILYNQDFADPVAVLMCTIDFSKAFNRIDHNLVITKLSDMGVPGWLLNLVCGFLANRNLIVKYRGLTSSSKLMPGGSPQGTLLGLFLFLIMINPVCDFDRNMAVGREISGQRSKFTPATFCAKFVDDLSIAESLKLKEILVNDPEPVRPEQYHARLGLKLPTELSKVFSELKSISEYSEANNMKLNFDKTKFMLFNPTKSFDFIPELIINDTYIETLDQMKILGVIVSDDLSWKANTNSIVIRAYKKLWIVKRLKLNGANLSDLVEVYTKQIRSILEFGVPVWNSGLTTAEVLDIERVQKSFLHIALGDKYVNYPEALLASGLSNLEERRVQLCTNFAIKALRDPKHSHWFSLIEKQVNTRSKVKFRTPTFKHERFRNSPISYLTELLNSHM